MTPPSLSVAREILTDAATKGRASGDPFGEIAAAAIDVVLARLEEHGNAPTVRVPVVGDDDGPPIGSAQVGGARATISMAVDAPPDPAGRHPLEVRVGPVSVGYAPIFGRTIGEAGVEGAGVLAKVEAIVDDAVSQAMQPAPTNYRPGRGGVEVRTRDQAIALFGCGSALADVPLPFVMVGGAVVADPAPGAPRSDRGSVHEPATAPLPCPFCGRADGLRVESHPDRALGPPNVTLACVRCHECGCAGPARAGGPGDRAQAIERWNCRASPPPDADRCATCGAALPLSAGRRGCAECYDPDAPP